MAGNIKTIHYKFHHYLSLTECPYRVYSSGFPRVLDVGSIACTMCKYHVGMDRAAQTVSCKFPDDEPHPSLIFDVDDAFLDKFGIKHRR